MIGLIIYVYKKNEILEKTFSISNVDEAKIKLVNYLANEFNILYIDFPLKLSDFEYIWSENHKMENLDTIFNYNLFDSSDNLWKKPWDNDEIYNDILDNIILLEVNNNKDYELE